MISANYVETGKFPKNIKNYDTLEPMYRGLVALR